MAIVDTTGTDTDEEIFTNFRYSNVDNVKIKLLKMAVKTKKVLESQSTDAFNRSKSNKVANLNNEMVKQMVAQYLDKTELNGFASLRADSKKAVLHDMIRRFLREELNIEEYSTEFVKLNELCSDMGVDFEQIFYDQIMKDPTVKRETEDQQSLSRGTNVRSADEKSKKNPFTASGHMRSAVSEARLKPPPKELDAVSTAINSHYAHMGKSNMKISELLAEKYQFEFKQAYSQNDLHVVKKIEMIKEIEKQKKLILSRKSDYRIRHAQTKKVAVYNQK